MGEVIVQKINLILAMFILAFVAITCDYIDYKTGNYYLGIVSLAAWFLVIWCAAKLTNFFGLGGKFR